MQTVVARWSTVRAFAWTDEEKPWNTPVRIADIVAEIWTRYLLNTRQKSCRMSHLAVFRELRTINREKLNLNAACWSWCFGAPQVLWLLIGSTTPKKGSPRTSLAIISSSSREPRKNKRRCSYWWRLWWRKRTSCLCAPSHQRDLCAARLVLLYWFCIDSSVFTFSIVALLFPEFFLFVLQFLSFIQTKGYFCQKEKRKKKMNWKTRRESHSNTGIVLALTWVV
jgi:hypothetical protein